LFSRDAALSGGYVYVLKFQATSGNEILLLGWKSESPREPCVGTSRTLTPIVKGSPLDKLLRADIIDFDCYSTKLDGIQGLC
jgi:hypothetical protein